MTLSSQGIVGLEAETAKLCLLSEGRKEQVNEGKWEWGHVELLCPLLLLPQGLGIACVFVDEIGALMFVAHSEAAWADLGPSVVFRGLLSVSLRCTLLLHSCPCFTLGASQIAVTVISYQG